MQAANDAAGPDGNPLAVPVASRDQAVSAALERNRGRLVRAAGDGVLAVFDAPSEALRCAFDICAGARHVGVRVRAAVHLGEIDSFPNGEIQGISLRIAELVVAHAATDEVLVTQTVRDAVYGSSLVFRPRGDIDLSGAGNWNLFAAIPQ
jgi:class 3 adenylate cyclase